MQKSKLLKMGLAVVVLIAFFIFLKVNDYRTKHFNVNTKAFHVKTTKQALLDAEFSTMPLLTPANRYHIMMDENVNVPLVNMRRTLHIQKVWLYQSIIYILYSIDLKNSDKTLADVPQLSFSKVQLHFNNGKTVTVPTRDFIAGQTHPTRSTYNYQVFDEMFSNFQLTPQDLPNVKSSQDYMNVLKKIDKVTLLDPSLNLKNNKTALKPITFPAKLNQDKYFLGSSPINKELKVKGTTIQFDQVKKYFDHNELEYKTINNKKHLLDLQYRVNRKASDPSQPNFYMSNLNLDSHTAFLGVSEKSITIIPEKVTYKSDKKVKITITPTMFKQLSSGNTEQKVADVPNGQIYFGFDRSIDSNSFYVGFKQDPTKQAKMKITKILPKNQAEGIPQQALDHSTLISFTSSDGMSINLKGAPRFIADVKKGETKVFFSMIGMNGLNKGFSIHLNGFIYQEAVKANPTTISIK